MHGKISPLAHTGRELFEGLKSPINVVRYHSFVIDKHSLPDCFEVTGTSMDDGEVMAIRHRQHSLFGLQFHPESIETEDGKFILENFTKLIAGRSYKMRTVLERLSEGKSLNEQEMEEAMNLVFSEDITDSELGAFLIGLKTKGETVEEIVGLVKALRKRAVPFKGIHPQRDG